MEVQLARDLRKEMTLAEVRLWLHLRRGQMQGHSFRRQVPMGPYVVDFVCLKARLVIEVDGDPHAFAVEKDTARTAWLEEQGFRVLRFWNHEVLHATEGVLETILCALQGSVSAAGPLPALPSRGRDACYEWDWASRTRASIRRYSST
jgi:very-short-patch-repair endonuclease